MKKFSITTLLLAILFSPINSLAHVPMNNSILSIKDHNSEQVIFANDEQPTAPRSAIEQIVKGTIYNQSVLTLTISMNDILNVKIFDEFGSLLYTGTYSPSNPSAITVDVSSWDSGKYEVTLRKISNEPFLSGEFTIH